MEQKIYNSFLEFMGNPTSYEKPSKALINKYKEKFMGSNDTVDIINFIWRKDGLCSYKSGLFSLVNPDHYNDIARKFPDISDNALVFAKSATGCLFILEEYSFGKVIMHLNVHYGTSEVIANEFDMLFEWNLPATFFWKNDCFGSVELKVIEKSNSITWDECYAFVPSISLGGSKSISKMEPVKVLEHLEFLAQTLK
ncbi:T6SS immunity protein Tdi1 domain-containing protein [Flavivirga jejuensis]|uniref:DUF1851 domain-containing protein n=1 Tax=Flavivirga jejuensis TaxID=870487 RepID=A0ABT8WQR6_9FLAO|nr:T6SS immunity protein Tdi1 domain-containing protein [Flavivirga jejuensis]MDO5975495.1 DUF1851 domain-containing protein [Flavivirga jejuensis]